MPKSNLNFKVEKEISLYDFLRENITNKSKNNIKSMLTNNCIVVNDKVKTKYDYKLKKNDIVKVLERQIKNDKFKEEIDVIYEDKNIIVINKPAGLLSIATNKEKEKTAYSMVMDYLRKQNNKIFIVHRLDRDTSGVLLFAKNNKTKHVLQDNWNEIIIKRGYIALVEGITKEKGTIKSYLKESKSTKVYSTSKQNGVEAITHYKKLKNNDKYSLLEVEIDTGRKNQIRVQMHDIGHCVVGDKKYESKVDPLKRLGLHANILEYRDPINNKIMHFEAPIPIKFKTVVNYR